MTLRAASWFLLAGLTGGGCAYYNGLYNANRLAGEATRATREGRPGEARSKWEAAAIKAESVAIRYPHSKYHDDALLLQGRALLESSRCDQASVPLVAVAEASPDHRIRRQAALLLGECRVLLGDPERARQVLGPLVESEDAATARAARVWRARASLAQADYAGALHDLTGMADTSAVFDRAAALIGLGRAPEAAAALIGLAPGGYDERRWPAALESLGAVAPEEAATLVDSLVRRGNLSSGQRARLLLADAIRWEQARRQDRFEARLRQVTDLAPDSAEGRIAGVHLSVLQLRQLRDPEGLPELADRLDRLGQDGGPAAALAAPPLAILKRVIAPDAERFPDLRRFLDAEVVRDSLGAPLLAAALFRRIQRDFSASPLAPKALLAAAMLEPDSAAVFAAAVDSLYPDSPYRIAFRQGDAEFFTALEDSLRALAGRDEEPSVRQEPRGRQPPVTPGQPRPGNRTPRLPTGRGVPEP
ncbi:MAG: hypothetical protein HY700_00625 [Gemmatimonadetes bacterium]|nr:hypothetical protein [Gemmatimonadota bacterium]